MLLHSWQEVHHVGVVGWSDVEFLRTFALLLMFVSSSLPFSIHDGCLKLCRGISGATIGRLTQLMSAVK
jgi:hypothetical protein